MSNIKQVLCVRKDLNMRKGKIAAQCAHASMKVFLDQGIMMRGPGPRGLESLHGHLHVPLTSEMREWLEGLFTKVCISVDSEQELIDVYTKAKEANLPCALVTDAGLTEFNGIPTNTVVAIGPALSEEIDKITGSLKLL
jgi:PTH2 family peptidyl-tRNA hydrolase